MLGQTIIKNGGSILMNVLLGEIVSKWENYIVPVNPFLAGICFFTFFGVLYWASGDIEKHRAIWSVGWSIYFTFLVSVTLLSRIGSSVELLQYRISLSILSTNGNPQTQLFEVLFNTIMFIPAGIWVSCFKMQCLPKVLLMFLFASTIELCQLLFNCGVFEVHDILWNTVGGSAGIVIVKLCECKGMKKYDQ